MFFSRLSIIIAFLVSSSCSYIIDVVDGNMVNGVKVYPYKARILKEDESIIVGRVKVIDKMGGLGSPNQDISNYCQILVYDNSFFNKDRSDITNPNLIWATDFPHKGIASNIYNGYFAAKVKGKDVYFYGLKCENPRKFEQDFIKSDFYKNHSLEMVTGYEFDIRSYLEVVRSNEIYNVGSLTFIIWASDEKPKKSNTISLDSTLNVKKNDFYIYANFFQSQASDNIDFLRSFINFRDLPKNEVNIKFRPIKVSAKLIKPK